MQYATICLISLDIKIGICLNNVGACCVNCLVSLYIKMGMGELPVLNSATLEPYCQKTTRLPHYAHIKYLRHQNAGMMPLNTTFIS